MEPVNNPEDQHRPKHPEANAAHTFSPEAEKAFSEISAKTSEPNLRYPYEGVFQGFGAWCAHLAGKRGSVTDLRVVSFSRPLVDSVSRLFVEGRKLSQAGELNTPPLLIATKRIDTNRGATTEVALFEAKTPDGFYAICEEDSIEVCPEGVVFFALSVTEDTSYVPPLDGIQYATTVFYSPEALDDRLTAIRRRPFQFTDDQYSYLLESAADEICAILLEQTGEDTFLYGTDLAIEEDRGQDPTFFRVSFSGGMAGFTIKRRSNGSTKLIVEFIEGDSFSYHADRNG